MPSLLIKRISMKRFILIFFAIITIGVSTSTAGEIARATRTLPTTTTSWSVVAVEQNQAPLLAPFILTWSVSSSLAYDYFTFRNIGGVTANNFFVTISQQRVSGNAPAGEIFFERCVGGVWNTTNDSCSGTVVLSGKASDTSMTFSGVSIAPNVEIAMRARTAISNRNQFQTTLSVQISRNDIRAKQVVHS